MPFNNPNIPPPPIAEAFVDADGVLEPETVTWFLQTLLPAIAQSPSVFSTSGPVFDEEATDAIALTPLPIGSLSAGLYRVSAYLRVLQPDGVSSSVTPIVSFPDDGITCTATGNALVSDAIDEPNSTTFVIEIDAPGPISFGTLYVSNTPNAMEYKAVATVERLQ